MIFNSFTFIFICFIPCVLLISVVNSVIKSEWSIKIQNLILLVFSILFFAWSGTQYVQILILLIVVNYVLGILNPKNKIVLLTGIVFNVGILFYYKYFNLVIQTINEVFKRELSVWEIAAPLGISFIVFECISYLMDLHQGTAGICRRPVEFALYLSFFPKLAQGPIVKYKDMDKQLLSRELDLNKFVKGVERFVIGLSKKVLIGDILAQTYSTIYLNMGMGMDAGTAWIAVISYTFGLYMDFSGYSDMAIGMAAMFGFEFEENFNFPYRSISVTEFWRRWHISLGAWFREYLYFPMGGSRKGNVYLHLMIVFIVTGIWHGAAWIYLAWGGLHGICVVAERYMMKQSWYKKIPVFCKWAFTFVIVSVGWIAFNLHSLTEVKLFLSYLVGMGTQGSFSAFFYLTPRLITLFVIVIAGNLILGSGKVQNCLKNMDGHSVIFNSIKYAALILCLCLCFITMVSEGYMPFLYFQF